MAQFKVGDRVRIVAIDPRAEPDVLALLGQETVIVGAGEHYEWRIGPQRPHCPAMLLGFYEFDSIHLAPLTPPAADTWAADKVKQVTKPQHVEPVVERVTTND